MSVHWFGIREKKRRSFGWAQCPGLYLGNVLWVLTWSPFCCSTVVMEDSTCITWVSGWHLVLVLLVVCIFLACLCGLSSHVGCINSHCYVSLQCWKVFSLWFHLYSVVQVVMFCSLHVLLILITLSWHLFLHQAIFQRHPWPEKEYQSFSLLHDNEQHSLDLVSLESM